MDQLVQLLQPGLLRLFHPEVHLGLMARPVLVDLSHPQVRQRRPDLADRQFLEDLAVRQDLEDLEHPADPQGPERLALAALRKLSAENYPEHQNIKPVLKHGKTAGQCQRRWNIAPG